MALKNIFTLITYIEISLINTIQMISAETLNIFGSKFEFEILLLSFATNLIKTKPIHMEIKLYC